MEAYSTATVQKREKIDYWQALCSRTYADLKLTPRDPGSSEEQLQHSCAGSLSLCSSAARITRSSGEAQRSAERYEL